MNIKSKALVTGIVLCVFVVFGCRSTGPARLSSAAGRSANDIRKAELEKELAKKWENPVVHYELGQLYRAEGDWSKADWHYDQAISFNPVYRDAQAAKVEMQLYKGDRSKGEYLANMYISQAASSPEQLLSLGTAFEKQSLDDYALRCYESALKMAPDSPVVNRQLGYYYLAKKKNDLAKEYFIRSFQLNPNQPDVAGELGKLGVAVRIPQAESTTPTAPTQPIRPATQP